MKGLRAIFLAASVAVLTAMCVGSVAAASPPVVPNTLIGPPGNTCQSNVTWYPYNVIVPAFGAGAALTDAEPSTYETFVNVDVSTMPSQYNNEIYAQATNETGNQLSAYEPIADLGDYDLWYNDYGSNFDVRVGFAGSDTVIYRVQVTGEWSPNC